jgi:dihydropteroate synthase
VDDPGVSAWAHGRGALPLAAPRVMAVVNATPDSFFDGGRWMAPESDDPNTSVVLRICRSWVEQGADILDVGGESTRPGSKPVGVETELRRVLPLIERLAADEVTARAAISIDTRHAAVARTALGAGAAIVNDVSGLADPEMAAVAAEAGAGLVIGHLRGEPADMQEHVHFDDVVGEVEAELCASVDRALAAGVRRENIVVDPCIGFGKTAEQSAALTASGARLREGTGCPVLIGVSRKSFLGRITGRPVGERMLASVAAGMVAVAHGASILRVHDVSETLEALAVERAIERAWREQGGRRR